MPVDSFISLVIPTYNRGHLIEETIASALAQDLPFAEIIVVDDGSTDDTLARLASLGDSITLIRLGRGGVQRARNAGVAACSSPYVALCDSDDLLLPSFVHTMARVTVERPETDLWYCNFSPFIGDAVQQDKLSLAPEGFLYGATHGEGYCADIPNLYEKVLRYQPFFPTGSVVRKSFYQSIKGYDPRFNGVGGEDFEFLLRAICSGSIGYVTEALAAIRKHDSNDSKDNLRMLNGETQILEYSLSSHHGAARYRAAIVSSIDKRRRAAFDIAYARGDFPAAINTAKRFSVAPTDSNFRIKKAISNFPGLVRDVVWRLSQSVQQN
jgi:glycosyltransferase involved in cell wall biosynthesis